MFPLEVCHWLMRKSGTTFLVCVCFKSLGNHKNLYNESDKDLSCSYTSWGFVCSAVCSPATSKQENNGEKVSSVSFYCRLSLF